MAPLLRPPYSRDIVLPFNLRKDPKAFSQSSNAKMLSAIFPGTEAVTFERCFLVITVRELILIPKPWPQTVAGVQLYLTTDHADHGPIASMMDRPGRSRIEVSPEVKGRDVEEHVEDLFTLVRTWFNDARIPITEVQYWDNFFVIVLEDKTIDMTQVPKRMARCACYYLFEEDMCRAKEFPALRTGVKESLNGEADNSQNPWNREVDNSHHDTLYPDSEVVFQSLREAHMMIQSS